ncbi:GNAT family N-acetyltransferase [Shewanella donghaensis]|uniref:GNAT family N-acetyltransferase n=1 Tax=Shewanella donghaensis TaxID=238836 RepID=UPI001183AB9B|nr:GNAT family N-acetyltransferase [Shewanella donghaensis]
MQIRLASELDLDVLVNLFDDYRQSLGFKSEPKKCRNFVKTRLVENDSMILIALEDSEALGFVQLYPSYSSLLLKSVWYFDDVFVEDKFRGKGIATELINKAKALALGTEVLLVKRTKVVNNEADQTLTNMTETEGMYFYHSDL